MFTQPLQEEDRCNTIATLDIETSGVDGTSDQLVAIGVGYFDATEPTPEIDVVTRGSIHGTELDVIDQAFNWINQRGPEAVITYNGTRFDFKFLNDRMSTLSADPTPVLDPRHIDIFLPRREAASRANQKWPKLEECLAGLDLPLHETTWRGESLDNTRFGEELAPAYLSTIEAGGEIDEFESIIFQYTASDIEANIALYEADAGREYVPKYDF